MPEVWSTNALGFPDLHSATFGANLQCLARQVAEMQKVPQVGESSVALKTASRHVGFYTHTRACKYKCQGCSDAAHLTLQ